ncbi:MAG: hypothetical protein IPL78_16985 [Chloroflexi bacterium]|nr:hypothetical protein [Chloroflexota bacterium]
MKKQLAEAIAAARAGERERARHLLQDILNAKPRGRELTETLYWLSLLSTDGAEKQRYLKQILRLDPQHERAQQQLRKLPPVESATPTAPDVRQCPTCGGPLYFSGDGRTLVCERCGYRHQNAAAPTPNRIRDLEAAVRFSQ